MKASELRIGNYFKHSLFEDYLEIQSISESGLCSAKEVNGGFEIEHTNPIPLTEEWLLKFGFETNDVRYWQISAFRLHINRYGEWIFKVETFEQEIKYVHQLQNLYFDLVGEELKQQEQ
jgi:hypothetical protein